MKMALFIYRFKHKLPIPWTAITPSILVLVITFLVGYIFNEALNRIATVEDDCQKMRELKARAEAADVAKSQVNFENQTFFLLTRVVLSLKCFIF